MDDPDQAAAPGPRPSTASAVETVKLPLHVVWTDPDYLAALQEHVEKVNFLTTHTMQFARYIFVREMQQPGFDAAYYVHESFFREVFQYLTTRQQNNVTGRTATVRELIEQHVGGYMARARIQLTPFLYAGQVAQYEAERIVTAYSNNVSLRYGNNLRGAINRLLDVREASNQLRQQMHGRDPHEIREAIWQQIGQPAKQAKQAILRGNFDLSAYDWRTRAALRRLRPVFATYPDDYEFADDDLEADSHLHPERHLKALYALARLTRELGGRVPQCFPLRSSWIPAHTRVDTNILCEQVLGLPSPGVDMKDAWGLVVDLDHKAFRPSGGLDPDKRRRFWGSVETDGMSVSIIKKTSDEKEAYRGCQHLEPGQEPRDKRRKRTNRKRKRGADAAALPRADIPYIHQVPQAELQATAGRCLLLDPGRRDRLHGIHEDSTAKCPKTFRLTRNQEATQRRTTRFLKILQKAKKTYAGGDVRAAENSLAGFSCHTLDVDEFDDYIVARSRVWKLLSRFYSSAQTVHVGSHHQFHATREQHLADKAAGVQLSKTQARKARQYLAHEPQNYPLHRKLRLSSYLNKKRFDASLAKELRRRFGWDVVLVIGNWSAPMAQFQEPQRGKGLRRMLRKKGFTVYLIDEFRTSMTCPACGQASLRTFKEVPNPRPWRRARDPTVICHGLQRCNSDQCMEAMAQGNGSEERWRLWNRDMAAAINFRDILFSLREDGVIPDRFRRGQPRPQAAAGVQPAAHGRRRRR
ncbi:hypothetical protein H4R19_001746 [Coemansia spiralis]|nr:hypothetical protein H4R19_001746 [Coemansia spiralis]